jgi:hypothetical protein
MLTFRFNTNNINNLDLAYGIELRHNRGTRPSRAVILRGFKVIKKELGLTERLILSMATDMAETQRGMERAVLIFQALALAAGVNVLHVFELVRLEG